MDGFFANCRKKKGGQPITGNNSSGSAPQNEYKWDEGFDVDNAYADVRKLSVFRLARWYRVAISHVSKHGVSTGQRIPFQLGDRVQLLLKCVAYEKPIRASAIVVTSKTKSKQLDIGFEFLKIAQTDRKKLDRNRYLQNLLERHDSEL